jgi:hypothetical protein
MVILMVYADQLREWSTRPLGEGRRIAEAAASDETFLTNDKAREVDKELCEIRREADVWGFLSFTLARHRTVSRLNAEDQDVQYAVWISLMALVGDLHQTWLEARARYRLRNLDNERLDEIEEAYAAGLFERMKAVALTTHGCSQRTATEKP